MNTDLQKKLSSLVKDMLKDEEESVKLLVLRLLDFALDKKDIASMDVAVRNKMDSEIMKLYETGNLDFDEDDDKFNVI